MKTRIDSSLNLYEHCVACADENNCPAGPALRGQPAGPLTPLTMLRLALHTACRGVNTPRKAVYSHIFVSKDGQRSAHGAFLPAQMRPKGKTSAFWRIWLYLGKRPVLRPILTHFEAIFGLHRAARGPTGQLWAPKWGPPSPSRPPILHIFGGCPVLGGLIQWLRGLIQLFRPF